jgi:uncharacterized protein (TIGR03435 family)
LREILCVLVVSATTLSAQAPLAFDVASIKPAVNVPDFVTIPTGATGSFAMPNTTIRTLVLRGYPVQTVPAQVIGLPSWAESDRYDITAKGKVGASIDEQHQMWQSLLADRLKLQAHYETRDRPGYNLVFARADKRLGSQIQSATLDCSKPAALLTSDVLRDASSIEAAAMQRCGILSIGSTAMHAMYSGSVSIPNLARSLSGSAGRPVVDRTGLAGNYAIKLTFASEAPNAPQSDAPSLFTAIQEQLGLKLDAETVQGQVLVIDHIERPSEN